MSWTGPVACLKKQWKVPWNYVNVWFTNSLKICKDQERKTSSPALLCRGSEVQSSPYEMFSFALMVFICLALKQLLLVLK